MDTEKKPLLSLVLASASPRRRLLLEAAGVACHVCPADIDEHLLAGESPARHVERLAYEKAICVAERFPGEVVLGADTVVVLGEMILGKPRDFEEAKNTLRQLSGNRHHVFTGVALCCRDHGIAERWVCRTEVQFREFDEKTIDEYLRRVNPLDKAGSYGIQEHGELLVAGIEGSYSNVVGLPVEDVVRKLKERFGALL